MSISSLTKQTSLLDATQHYENFPVASVLLPKHLRLPIAYIYQFARQADDFADEGDASIEERLRQLNAFNDELHLLIAYIKPSNPFFIRLGDVIKAYHLPYPPFFDLISAFKQDVIKTRYANFDEVLDYCTRSANPIGRLMLHLYRANSVENIRYADHICTALQLINFLQDIAIDFEKNAGKQRIYLCQNELASFAITENMIQTYVEKKIIIDKNWSEFMAFNLNRAKKMLIAGKPLGGILKGRIGLEMRMIIAGGERIIGKIQAVEGDVFNHRPILNKWDWCVIFYQALINA